MRLSKAEFKAMNNPVRRFLQRTIEFPTFVRLGLRPQNQDILEIGCGSGYGAALLSRLHPRSYVGVDIMPEQIALAQQRRLANAEFLALDATDLSRFADSSKDVVVIFGILHHIPHWRDVLRECARVLRQDGKVFLEEPYGGPIRRFERIFHWGHTPEAAFTRADLENGLREAGFVVERTIQVGVAGVYAARKA